MRWVRETQGEHHAKIYTPFPLLSVLFEVRFQDQVEKPRVAADDRQRASGVERLHYEVLTVTDARTSAALQLLSLGYKSKGIAA